VAWDDLPIEVPIALHNLLDLQRPAIAGVSAQGLSATNAHVVLREVPCPSRTRWATEPRRAHLLAISARTERALNELAGAYIAYLESDGKGHKFALADICFSAATRREHHARRIAVVGGTHEQVADELRRRLAGPMNAASRSALLRVPPTEQPLASNAGDRAAWLRSLTHAYEEGADLTWADCCEGDGQYVPVPTYPWQMSACSSRGDRQPQDASRAGPPRTTDIAQRCGSMHSTIEESNWATADGPVTIAAVDTRPRDCPYARSQP
jgi:acyl transferase domain-containing protein